MAVEHRGGCMAKSVASAYVFVYGVLYVAAAILGMRMEGVHPAMCAMLLGMGGVLCFAGLFIEAKLLRVSLAVLWGFACIANWMKMMTWIPAYSDLQYTVMAVMNMGNAVSLALLGEVWKIG